MNLKQNQHLKLDVFGYTSDDLWSALDVLWSVFGVSLECF